MRAHSISAGLRGFFAAVVGSAFLVGACLQASVGAVTVLSNESPFNSLHAFGERPPGLNVADEYYAQTFTTPELDTRVDKIGFWVSNTSTGTFQGYDISGPITLRLLLTTFITNETGFHPDQVLFESEPIVVPHKPFPESPPYFDYIEVDLPEVLLQPSTSYAFVLDAASDLNLDDDVHAYMTVASTRGFGSEMFWNARVLWEQTGGMIGPRSEHFSQVWYGYDESLDVDMAFRITLVPEPSTWTLSLVAVGSVIWLARRRANAR